MKIPHSWDLTGVALSSITRATDRRAASQSAKRSLIPLGLFLSDQLTHRHSLSYTHTHTLARALLVLKPQGRTLQHSLSRARACSTLFLSSLAARASVSASALFPTGWKRTIDSMRKSKWENKELKQGWNEDWKEAEDRWRKRVCEAFWILLVSSFNLSFCPEEKDSIKVGHFLCTNLLNVWVCFADVDFLRECGELITLGVSVRFLSSPC